MVADQAQKGGHGRQAEQNIRQNGEADRDGVKKGGGKPVLALASRGD